MKHGIFTLDKLYFRRYKTFALQTAQRCKMLLSEKTFMQKLMQRIILLKKMKSLEIHIWKITAIKYNIYAQR